MGLHQVAGKGWEAGFTFPRTTKTRKTENTHTWGTASQVNRQLNSPKHAEMKALGPE